jgi:hypothetical protein
MKLLLRILAGALMLTGTGLFLGAGLGTVVSFLAGQIRLEEFLLMGRNDQLEAIRKARISRGLPPKNQVKHGLSG